MEPRPGLELKRYLEENSGKVFKLVRAFLLERAAGIPGELYRQVADYSLRKGKYTRPGLIMMFARTLRVSGKDIETTRKLAAIYQILNDWGIAEDDILDSGKLRRGGETLHLRYGLDFAVNAMDLLHTYFMGMLREVFRSAPPETYFGVYDIFQKATEITLLGQYLDIKARKKDVSLFTEKEYFAILAHKTGYMTGVTLLELGNFFSPVKLAGGTVEKLGLPIGMAYQLKDDILDMDVKNRNEPLFSKRYGNDVFEGKRTLLIVKLLERAGRAEKKNLLRIYGAGRKDITREDADYVIELMYEKGVIDYAKGKLETLRLRIMGLMEKEVRPRANGKYYGLLKDFLSFFYSRTF